MIACPRCGLRMGSLMVHTTHACAEQRKTNDTNRAVSAGLQPRCRWCGAIGDAHREGCPESKTATDLLQERITKARAR